MPRRDKQIKAAFDRLLWRERASTVVAVVFLLGLVSVPLLALAYWWATPLNPVATRSGEVIGAHDQYSKSGRRSTYISVHLDDGPTVSVRLPYSIAYRAPAQAKIITLRRAWWPNFEEHRFGGYVAAAPKTSSPSPASSRRPVER